MGAITISDRMMTAFDVEYEPQQQKVCHLTPRILILCAGDIAIHSQALKETQRQIHNKQNATPENVALIYGRSIQAVRRRHAEDLYLAPIGLNTDTFLAQQRELSDDFVNTLRTQMQDYRGSEVEALIVGSDGENAQIYGVDSNGIANCYDDIGFAAIGIGA
jgi:20S proteasome alpha/beta subunit